MAIWKRAIDLSQWNDTSANSMVSHLGMELISYDDNSITMSMPVDSRTHQPMGLLHGGASVALAESVGSIAANMCVSKDYYCVGLDINANHIRATRSGTVFATATPAHLGATTQVWQIEITDERQRLVCTSRLTMAVLRHKGDQ
ncbi:hotdog fold thioesterase [Ferrimonas lipolytica]|uniref:Hotdog fold thioesterase n=1 Tax=Ferrimonas lipolytica TaxID=2724191 RepID=A0A6H1UA69_9GAMM|nr:hotdog fold thioesterase [Ferrimonas lipolytica]QIZ75529.1 hotdog fold thioesterase [Ferrimonas lipolytica]